MRLLLGTILTAMQVATPATAEPPQDRSAPPPMNCDTGPVHRMFGGTKWIVYSCDDQASMVILSATGNPALPFYFHVRPEDDGYRVSGQGTGDKKASRAALDALATMLPAEFSALLTATKRGTP